jgi:hypothetical protein
MSLCRAQELEAQRRWQMISFVACKFNVLNIWRKICRFAAERFRVGVARRN